MAKWVRIADLADCPLGQGTEVVVEDRILAIFNIDGRLFAIDGICPHQGGPLGRGGLTGCVVTCPWHGWQFDVRSGQHQINPNLRHPSFPVKVEGTDVFVDLEP